MVNKGVKSGKRFLVPWPPASGDGPVAEWKLSTGEKKRSDLSESEGEGCGITGFDFATRVDRRGDAATGAGAAAAGAGGGAGAAAEDDEAPPGAGKMAGESAAGSSFS